MDNWNNVVKPPMNHQKPTIRGWFIAPIYANKRDWFVIGVTTLQTKSTFWVDKMRQCHSISISWYYHPVLDNNS